eukprot:7176-Chlamydomonas_euryale.AAC.2
MSEAPAPTIFVSQPPTGGVRAVCLCVVVVYCVWMRITDRQLFDCSLASSAIWGCHEEGSGGGTVFGDFLKMPGHTELIPWPEVRAAAAERALDRQAWQDALKNLAPMKFKRPQQAGRMTRACARRGRIGYCCATLSSVRPGSRAVLLIQVQAWLMVVFTMLVT